MIYFQQSAVSVIIDVTDENDNAPTFEKSSYYAMITENRKIGSSVIKILAKDPDSGSNGKVGYSLANTNGIFQINADNGMFPFIYCSTASCYFNKIRIVWS